MREMDLLLGTFADHHMDSLGNDDLDDFEALMELPDKDLLAWMTGAEPVAANYATPVYRAILAFHATRHDEEA